MNSKEIETIPVWGGYHITWQHGQVRAIVGSKTKKGACEALGITIYELNMCFAKTGNNREVLIGCLFPGEVWVFVDNKKWKRLEDEN